MGIARRRFLTDGYGPTSLRAIAEEAGVSPEFLYKTFEGKAGLVRAIYERTLLGSGAVPAPLRSDEAQAHETDGRALMRRFGSFTAEVAPLGAPVLLLIRDAAAGGDATMIALLEDADRARYERMLHNAQQVAARGFLRAGFSVERAAAVFWAMTAPELYESLVLKRGWSAAEFGEFVGDSLAGAVLG
jgi:AcrR family transcriptional regulator